jgi:CRP-like cAMP-binding protein
VDLHSFVLKPMDHFIGVAAPSVFAKVPHESIQSIIEKHPRLTKALMWDMALDAATGREWMVSIGRRQAYERLAHLFCELFYRMDFVGLVKNGEFSFLLTQADVADITGLSAVHVNRSLQALRKDGLLIAEDKKIRIADIKSLEAAGMFDSAYLHQLTKPEMPDS